MISNLIKNYRNYIFIILFLILTYIHFSQAFIQHWSSVLDQDLVIIYNSILLNSGLDQEYRDHPGFSTFLINSYIYNLFNIFFDYPSKIQDILKSKNIDDIFQYYFYISRTTNFFFNILLVIYFNKIVQKLFFDKNTIFLLTLSFIISIGFLSSFFFLRSENLSLLFLFFSINFILSKKNNLIINFFIAGIFFALAMMAKIQIIFLAPLLIYLIPIVNKDNDFNFVKNIFIKKYLILSLIFGILIYFIFQLYIQEFERFKTNKYLDLIFFSLSLIFFYIYFYFSNNLKNNFLLFSSFLNGFISLIIILILLDKINLLQVNDYIFLRITNPIHYMTEFTGNMANGVIHINYLFENIFQIFSGYKFSKLELILLLFLVFLDFRRKNNNLFLFIIFLLNSLIMNFRFNDIYYIFYSFIYLFLFTELIKKFERKKTFLLSCIVLFLFFIDSLNFFFLKKENFVYKVLKRENAMIKICNQINFKTVPDSYETVEYIKYWHNLLDDEKIKKICIEQTKQF